MKKQRALQTRVRMVELNSVNDYLRSRLNRLQKHGVHFTDPRCKLLMSLIESMNARYRLGLFKTDIKGVANNSTVKTLKQMRGKLDSLIQDVEKL